MCKTCSFLLYNILHHVLFQAKGHKELVGFLFNDFLLLATPLSSATSNSLFDSKTKAQYKMYKSVSRNQTEFLGVHVHIKWDILRKFCDCANLFWFYLNNFPEIYPFSMGFKSYRIIK